jgi:hypothetical protein
MEYKHNGLTKSETFGNTNNYILKVNSRDRDITREPNPFNFKIKFNKTSGKYTTYYEKGYFGSGNIWKKNDNNPQNNWNEGPYYYNKTFNINNGAVIEDPIEEIKDIKISEIVAPRFIPESEIGYKLYNIEAMSNPLDSSGIFLRGIDNTSIKYIDETVNSIRYQFCQIEDMYGKKYLLFNNVDVSNLPEGLKKNYYLFNDYYTDTLVLNNKIYKIYDISNGYIKLTDGNPGSVPEMDFLKTDISLAKFYYDHIWYQKASGSLTNITFEDSRITLDQSAESLITVDLVKNSYIEVSYRENSGDNLDYSYFKISSVQHEINLQINMNFSNANFNSSNKTITLDNLTSSNVSKIKEFVNINSVIVSNTNNNNNTLAISKIQQVGNYKIIITVSDNLNNEDSDATITFKKIITKTYPFINLTEAENNELKTFLSDNGSPDLIKNKVTINGSWKYNTKPSHTKYEYYFKHIKPGVRDLLNEKLFYVSLDPIVPSRNLTTNGKLNNIIGTFYPSTQSKNYIFLSGQNRQQYTHRNLQNLKELNFKLYYMDGTQVGETLKNYSLDYLELDCKQTNITFLIDQVDRHMS